MSDNKRFKLKNISHCIHILDTQKLNKVIQVFDKTESEDAELMLNDLNEKHEIMTDLIDLQKQLLS